MKIKYKELVAMANEITAVMDHAEAIVQIDKNGLCMACAKTMYKGLREHKIPCRVVGGRAAFSFNKGRFGIVDYGYDPKPKIEPGAEKIGHYWIVTGDYIIDPTLRNLSQQVRRDNALRGLPDEAFLLDEKIVLRKKELSSFRQLMDGKIGYHYLEVPGRGENMLAGKITRLVPINGY